jgi:hypothetical protein
VQHGQGGVVLMDAFEFLRASQGQLGLVEKVGSRHDDDNDTTPTMITPASLLDDQGIL